MISIHQEMHENRVARGWLNPFLPNPSLWLPHQVCVQENTLENVASAMEYYIWSTAIYRNNYRNNANFIEAHYVALDFDEGQTLGWAIDFFGSYRCVIGRTRSHQKEKYVAENKPPKPACDRFRVVIATSDIIYDLAVFKATVQRLISLFKCDPACCDPRFFFPCTLIDYVGPENGRTIDLVYPAPPTPRKLIAQENEKPRPDFPRGRHIEAIRAGAASAGNEGGRHKAIVDASWQFAYSKVGREEAIKWILQRSNKSEQEIRAAVNSAYDKVGQG